MILQTGPKKYSKDDFGIDEIADHYAVVYVNQSKVACGKLDDYESTIDFKKIISLQGTIKK